ncbi:MAG: hypothetical protein DRJ08_04595 [Acidobacteria bacterium]|nr:MAG: hypothetical protein DRJ14_00745 [Acidobacteriota bacterium]RLE22102.1 MAG: hypothetical protein DRJ08_04595 [Acidobacteriota bacterium]
MKISKRERVLSGALLVTAVIVWMLSGGGDVGVSNEAETPFVSSGRIFKQYSRIRPLPELKNLDGKDVVPSGRNIFQFGSRTVSGENGTGLGNASEQGKSGELNSGDNAVAAGVELNSESSKPKPPEVDFQVAGIILSGSKHAAVIKRPPELFVVMESQQFLEHFILKSVKREGIVIGYTDFKDELFIPLKKDGGLQ